MKVSLVLLLCLVVATQVRSSPTSSTTALSETSVSSALSCATRCYIKIFEHASKLLLLYVDLTARLMHMGWDLVACLGNLSCMAKVFGATVVDEVAIFRNIAMQIAYIIDNAVTYVECYV